MILACFVFGRSKNWHSVPFSWCHGNITVWGDISWDNTLQEQISQETPGFVENVLIVNNLAGWIYEEKLSQSGCTDGWVVSSAWLCEAHLWPPCSLGWTWQGPRGRGLVVSLENSNTMSESTWRGMQMATQCSDCIKSCKQKTIVGCTNETERAGWHSFEWQWALELRMTVNVENKDQSMAGLRDGQHERSTTECGCDGSSQQSWG